MIQINIEIKKRNRFKRLFYIICNKTEDILFFMIQKLPVSIVPKFIIDWLQQYMNKRIAELNQQIVHDKWKSMELNNAVASIRQQDTSKAPSGE